MDRKPEEVFHPGVHLRDEMEARNFKNVSQIEQEFGLYSELIFDIILGGADIYEPVAHVLSKSLGTSPEFWLNLQKQWDERNK